MHCFQDLLTTTANLMRHFILMLFVSHFIVQMLRFQVSANYMESPSRLQSLGGYRVSRSFDYELFMTSPENVYIGNFWLEFYQFTNSDCILKILGLSLKNHKLCDMESMEESYLTNRKMYSYSDSSIEQSDEPKVRIVSQYASLSSIQYKFNEIESFNLVTDSSIYDAINEIVAEIAVENIFQTAKFLFPKFTPESQSIILKAVQDSFPHIFNGFKLDSFNACIDILSSNQKVSEGKVVQFLKSTITSMFIETIVHNCLTVLPENLNAISINILFDTLIYLTLESHLNRFEQLKNIRLDGHFYGGSSQLLRIHEQSVKNS